MLIRYGRLVLIWSGAAVLALLAAISALGGVAKHRSPALVLSVWPANGAAYEAIADGATRRLVAANSSQDFSPDPALVEIARSALAAEPTSVSSLRILALHHDSQNRRDQARRLMRLAAAVTKRDTLANMWLIDDYGRIGDVDAMLAMYDQTLRSLGDGRGPVLTVMAAALSNANVVEPYYRLLRERPPWADSFWHVTAQTPGALENAARLRLMLLRSRIEVSQQRDEMLLAALVDQRRFETGFRLYEALRPVRAGDRGPINNADFSHASALQPFDWRLTSSGELGAVIDARAGQLQISAIAGAGAVAAEQLVRLQPGRYDLRADFSHQPASALSPGHVELVCAEEGATGQPIRVDLERSPTVRSIELTGSCRYYWIRIRASVDESQGTLELALDRLLLTRG